MATLNQLSRKGKGRIRKKKKTSVLKLCACPQKRGVIREVRKSVSPKKPNSAKRKVAKIQLTHTKKLLVAAIPGTGFNIQKFSIVLVRGGHSRDVPGVRYKLMKGIPKYDFLWHENISRAKSLSKVGKRKLELIEERQRYGINTKGQYIGTLIANKK